MMALVDWVSIEVSDGSIGFAEIELTKCESALEFAS